jgi:hypothetical protein
MNTMTAALLQRVLMRESYSLLQYLNEAFPWTPSNDRETLDQLQRLSNENQQAARRIAALLRRQRTVPFSGSFPAEFSTLHYVGLDHLLPRLVAAERWEIEQLARDCEQLQDHEARPPVEQLLAVKRRHLGILQSLAEKHAGERAVSTLR